jgi:hypothetical protein
MDIPNRNYKHPSSTHLCSSLLLFWGVVVFVSLVLVFIKCHKYLIKDWKSNRLFSPVIAWFRFTMFKYNTILHWVQKTRQKMAHKHPKSDHRTSKSRSKKSLLVFYCYSKNPVLEPIASWVSTHSKMFRLNIQSYPDGSRPINSIQFNLNYSNIRLDKLVQKYSFENSTFDF